MIAATVVSLVGASPAFAEGTKIAPKADRISLFEVPLRCEAAPEIGCGSRSKPILLGLEREPTIMEAWLNGTGTVLAVIRAEGSSREARTKVVQVVLEKNGDWFAESRRRSHYRRFIGNPDSSDPTCQKTTTRGRAVESCA